MSIIFSFSQSYPRLIDQFLEIDENKIDISEKSKILTLPILCLLV
jgi:hypothetical protein